MALISVDEAKKSIALRVQPLSAHEVDIEEAVGRALAAAVSAQRTLPPTDNASMDGYALRAADTRALTRLQVLETVFAGDIPQCEITAGTCARIMTGGTLPKGADTVLMQEQAQVISPQLIEVTEPIELGTHVRARGEDVVAGELLLPSGKELTIADAGILWAQGINRVMVHRRPRVAIVASGDELCDIGNVEPGKTVDTNSPVIAALVRRAGGVPMPLGRAADSLTSLQELLARGLEADVLITSAGASVGERDFTREALLNLEVEIDFWKVAMKPGKPFSFGKRGSTLVFGLPGNPVSAMVTFDIFVRPALRALQGLESQSLRLPARAAVAISKAAGLRHYIRASWEVRGTELWVIPTRTQSSGALSSAQATCLIDLPASSTGLEIGSHCELLPVSWMEGGFTRNLC